MRKGAGNKRKKGSSLRKGFSRAVGRDVERLGYGAGRAVGFFPYLVKEGLDVVNAVARGTVGAITYLPKLAQHKLEKAHRGIEPALERKVEDAYQRHQGTVTLTREQVQNLVKYVRKQNTIQDTNVKRDLQNVSQYLDERLKLYAAHERKQESRLEKAEESISVLTTRVHRLIELLELKEKGAKEGAKSEEYATRAAAVVLLFAAMTLSTFAMTGYSVASLSQSQYEKGVFLSIALLLLALFAFFRNSCVKKNYS